MASLTTYFTKKVIVSLSVVATLLTIVGGIWAFEAHYATNHRVDGVVLNTVKKFDGFEEDIASALENLQHKSDVRFFQLTLDRINDRIYELRKEIKRNPSDDLLKQDYEDLIRRRKEVQDKIDSSMRKIKVS